VSAVRPARPDRRAGNPGERLFSSGRAASETEAPIGEGALQRELPEQRRRAEPEHERAEAD